MKSYQLQLVDPVLKAQGIGVFPTQKLVIGVVALGIAWALWTFVFSAKEELVEVKKQPEVNPYQQYYNILSSPAPDQEIDQFLNIYNKLMLMPGWKAKELKYIHKNLFVTVLSGGGKIEELFNWANDNRMTITIDKSGIMVNKAINVKNRPLPQNIYKMNDIIATLVDRISTVFPGNNLMLSEFGKKGVFTQVTIQLRFTKVTPLVLSLIAKELEGLPVVLHDIAVTSDETFNLNGSLTIQALGN